ncbi:hypothetical protein KS4_27060 [Poriferisphaera corsica]|uniref:Uncharacterized protein n=1 Tax=Poriferisphaera corsica TaxID=2528020 RepID=A0A517YWM5_9BACT|nr:hypothetical protein KS4_27060 [Poriferisphaera corsica]
MLKLHVLAHHVTVNTLSDFCRLLDIIIYEVLKSIIINRCFRRVCILF